MSVPGKPVQTCSPLKFIQDYHPDLYDIIMKSCSKKLFKASNYPKGFTFFRPISQLVLDTLKTYAYGGETEKANAIISYLIVPEALVDMDKLCKDHTSVSHHKIHVERVNKKVKLDGGDLRRDERFVTPAHSKSNAVMYYYDGIPQVLRDELNKSVLGGKSARKASSKRSRGRGRKNVRGGDESNVESADMIRNKVFYNMKNNKNGDTDDSKALKHVSSFLNHCMKNNSGACAETLEAFVPVIDANPRVSAALLFAPHHGLAKNEALTSWSKACPDLMKGGKGAQTIRECMNCTIKGGALLCSAKGREKFATLTSDALESVDASPDNIRNFYSTIINNNEINGFDGDVLPEAMLSAYTVGGKDNGHKLFHDELRHTLDNYTNHADYLSAISINGGSSSYFNKIRLTNDYYNTIIAPLADYESNVTDFFNSSNMFYSSLPTAAIKGAAEDFEAYENMSNRMSYLGGLEEEDIKDDAKKVVDLMDKFGDMSLKDLRDMLCKGDHQAPKEAHEELNKESDDDDDE